MQYDRGHGGLSPGAGLCTLDLKRPVPGGLLGTGFGSNGLKSCSCCQDLVV